MAHLFKIPRKFDAALKPRYDLLRKHGKSRLTMVKFICGIGGYYADHTSYPIEFNVKMYPDLDADALWTVLRDKCDFGIAEWPAAKQTVAEHLFREKHEEHKQHLWDWAQEDMARSAHDDDWFTENWLGMKAKFEFELLGRGGGHLCLTSINGYPLTGMTPERLEAEFNEVDYSNGFVRGESIYTVGLDVIKALFVACIELTVMCERKALEAECQYKAAWTLWANICESDFDDRWKTYQTRERLSDDASKIRDHLCAVVAGNDDELVTSLDTIYQLAGITLES